MLHLIAKILNGLNGKFSRGDPRGRERVKHPIKLFSFFVSCTKYLHKYISDSKHIHTYTHIYICLLSPLQIRNCIFLILIIFNADQFR